MKWYKEEDVKLIELRAFEAGRGLTKDGWEQGDWEAFEKVQKLNGTS